jgi:hypothetical protein
MIHPGIMQELFQLRSSAFLPDTLST